MNAMGNIRRNPFWPVIVKECFHQGYTEVVPEESKHSIAAIIHGFTADGIRTTQKYVFPRTFKALESLRNFKSQFRNFLRQELPNRNFYPAPDHRTRSPGGTIAHFNHDVPKKKLVPPKSLQAAFGSLDKSIYDGLPCVPHIPEERPAPMQAAPVKLRKNDPNEPVSDSKVLAVFLVDARDLGTLIEVTDGTAKFRGSRPAPLRILGEQPKAAATEPVASTLVVQMRPLSAVPNLQPATETTETANSNAPKSMSPKRPRRTLSLADKVVQRINSDHHRKWRNEDLTDLSASANSIGPTLSVLAAERRIQRVSRGVYVAAVMQ